MPLKHQYCETKKALIAKILPLVIFVLLLPSYTILAQKDSIIEHHRDIVDTSRVDTLVIQSLIELGSAYFPGEPDSVYAFGVRAVERSTRISYCYGLINGLSLKAMSFLARNEIPESRPHYIKAESESEKCDMQNYQAMFLRILGNIDYTAGDYGNALNFWRKGIKMAEESEYFEAKIEMLSNIGKMYQRINEYDKAEEYFNLSREESIQHQITEFYPNSLLNLAYVALMKEEYHEVKRWARMIIQSADSIDKSRNFLPKAYEKLGNASLGLNQPDSALVFFLSMEQSLDKTDALYNGPNVLDDTAVQLGLGKSWIALGEIEKGKSALESALSLARENDLVDVIKEAAEELSLVSEKEGNYTESLQYFKMFKSASDSVLSEEKLRELSLKEAEFEFEEQARMQELEVQRLQQKEKVQQVIIVSLTLVAILIIALILLMFRLKSIKARKVELENEKLESNLEYKNRELASYVLHMMKKNELMLHLVPNLKKALRNSPKTQNGELKSILKDIEINSKEVGWDEFELRFKEVHSEFYEKLLREFPSLTNNEQRLCAFLKMKMTTKEISSITFQSVHSINVARSRMKKKMEINDNERLVHFLTTL